MKRTTWLHLGAAAVIGLGLRFVVGLEPLWWLAWFVPGLLLALALRTGSWASRGYVAVAAAIGVSVNVPFFLSVMPLWPTVLVMVLQVAFWMLLIGVARRIMLRFQSGWTVLALPVIGVAADTALAYFTPDGNWGSLAYTQAEVLPVAQLASVFGVGGVLFLLLLFNGAVGMAIFQALRSGETWRGTAAAYTATAIAFVATAAFGWWRLQAPEAGERVAFGIVSIDDFLDDLRSPKSEEVWMKYEAQVQALAAGGAKLVLLPEKINMLSPDLAKRLKIYLGQMARESRVWLVAGLGVDDGKERRNEAWWFAPDGQLVTNYLKHFMAPPEREFVAGNEFPVHGIDGVKYGVAICKDMHFPSLGRSFAQREAAVMLVPAWDFDRDARYAANITRMRGVESGFVIVRASRDGLLSVSDAYGRVLSEARSAPMPGTTLLAQVKVGPRVTTLYTRIGDALGWLCLAAALILIPWSLTKRGHSPIPGNRGQT